jgi:T5SS/PEP-CTERM-associated repeat protein
MARTLVWTGADGSNYSDPNNWNDTTDGLNPAVAAPGSLDTVTIDTSDTISGSGTALDLIFGPEPSFQGPDLTSTISVVDSLLVEGVITVDLDSALTVGGNAEIADGGLVVTAFGDTGSLLLVRGTLTIDEGGTLFGDGLVQANIDLAGSIQADVGNDASGTMEITGSITGTGTVEITNGGGLKLDSTDASVPIVFDPGSGTLVVSAGSLPTALIYGFAPGSQIVINGAGGDTDSIAVAGGITTLTLRNGATVVGSLRFAGAPPLSFDSATGVISAYGAGYTWAGSAGAAGQLGNPANWLPSQVPGQYDYVSIGNGAVLAGSLTVSSVGFSGTSTIEGTFAQLSDYGLALAAGTTVDVAAGATLQAAEYFLGTHGVTGAQINIAAGGALRSVGVTAGDYDASIKLGALAGGQAGIDVAGAGATFDSGGLPVWVGEAGSGTLTIADGATGTDGTLEAPLNYYWSTDVGVKVGSDGTMTVTGMGSSYTALQRLVVGDGGTGILTVSDGASLTAGADVGAVEPLAVDVANRNTGTLTITGAGTHFNSLGEFQVGDHADGQATVENAATLDAGFSGQIYSSMEVGGHQGSQGSNLLVTGVGSLVKSVAGTTVAYLAGC